MHWKCIWWRCVDLWILSLEMWLKLKVRLTKALAGEVLNNFCPLSFMLWISSSEAVLWKTCTQIKSSLMSITTSVHIWIFIWLCFCFRISIGGLNNPFAEKKKSAFLLEFQIWRLNDSACSRCIIDLNIILYIDWHYA